MRKFQGTAAAAAAEDISYTYTQSSAAAVCNRQNMFGHAPVVPSAPTTVK